MATFDTDLVAKKNRARGNHAGRLTSVTAVLPIAEDASFALTDLIRAVPLGENIRPVRVVLEVIPTSGTPVLTNATFDIGVTTIDSAAFERPDGTSFPVVATDADILAADAAIDADLMATDIEIPRPVADSVSNYAPFYVTLTPSGVGAFSVAGGDCNLLVTVEFAGETGTHALVYDEYINDKVAN